MKILITAMAAMAENAGPVSRSIALAKCFKNNGHEVVTCIAKDVNYKEIEGITNVVKLRGNRRIFPFSVLFSFSQLLT